jgi:hypothetical protein
MSRERAVSVRLSSRCGFIEFVARGKKFAKNGEKQGKTQIRTAKRSGLPTLFPSFVGASGGPTSSLCQER